MTITRSLLIDTGGNFVFGEGTLNAGSTAADTITVKGAFQIINMPDIRATGFVLTLGTTVANFVDRNPYA